MPIEKAYILKTLKLSRLYLEGQEFSHPVPQEIIKEARQGNGFIRLVETEEPRPAEFQYDSIPDLFYRDSEEFNERYFVERWFYLRKGAFKTFVLENLEKFKSLSEENVEKAVAKWKKFYVTPCPIKGE